MTLDRASLIKTALAALVTAVTLWLLIDAEVWHTLRTLVPGADIARLLAALALTPTLPLLRAWRFNLLLWGQGGVPPYALYRVTTFLAFFNYLLPFKAGELSFPVMMGRAYGTPIAEAIGSLVLVRALDLLTVLVIGGVLAHLLFNTGGALGVLTAPVAAIAAVATVVLPVAVGAFSTTGRRLLASLPRLQGILIRLETGMRCPGGFGHYLRVVGLTWVIWGVQIAIAHLSLSAVAQVGPWDAALGAAAATLSFSLPINGVAALGPMQAAWALTLQALGHSWGIAVSSALVWHAVMLGGNVSLSALVALIPSASARWDQ
jgi:uncharacterized membrane protein YbhN (UPF0104 family)